MPIDAKPVVPPATESNEPSGSHYDEDYTALGGDSRDEDVQEEKKPPVTPPTEESEEDEEKPQEEDKDEEEEDEEEKEEEEEEEESEKPPIPFDRPTVKEIKTAFPELFKKFPQLRESYFREIEFTKLFPTVEDAKEAFVDNEAFTTLSDSVLAGDPVPLLESIEKTDKKALELFSASFLPALYKRDSELYTQTVTPLFQSLVRQFYSSNDENTRNAALVLADFLFGSDGEAVAQGKKSVAKSLQVSEEQQRLKDQKDAQLSQKFQETYYSVDKSIREGLETLILKDFDPNKVFSSFLRKQGAKEVIERILKQLDSDEGHKQVMAARWKRAKNNGYTDEDKSKIVATFLARAKSLIPSTREKVRTAMLGTKERMTQNKRERVESSPRENNSGRPPGRREPQRIDYRKMSDMDILNS